MSSSEDIAQLFARTGIMPATLPGQNAVSKSYLEAQLAIRDAKDAAQDAAIESKTLVDGMVTAPKIANEAIELRHLTSELKSTETLVGVNAQLSVKMNIEQNHYYVGSNQKYATITAAYNQWVSDGKPTSVIHIFAGVYNEDINAGANVNLTFIGEDKNTTIWKCTKGLYVNAPFTGSGDSDGLHFRNLTIIANHDDIPDYIYKASTGGGAYALHIDDATSQGKTTIEDCILISYQNSALGSGTRLNQELTLRNVELYHYAEQYSPVGGENTGANNGALLYHTSATAGHTGQKVKFHNVYAWSLKGPALQMLSSSGGTVPVAVEISDFTARSPYYEGININNRVVFSNANGLMVLDENSKNNNSSYLNYVQKQIAKLTEDNGVCVTVTDFNTPRSGFFMGNGAAGCLNTPTSAWYFGMAINYAATSYCVQYVWAMTVGQMAKYKRSYNGTTWRNWVQVNEVGIYTTTANRPTNLTLGAMVYDTTLNKPIWLKTEPSTWVDATGTVV